MLVASAVRGANECKNKSRGVLLQTVCHAFAALPVLAVLPGAPGAAKACHPPDANHKPLAPVLVDCPGSVFGLEFRLQTANRLKAELQPEKQIETDHSNAPAKRFTDGPDALAA